MFFKNIFTNINKKVDLKKCVYYCCSTTTKQTEIHPAFQLKNKIKVADKEILVDHMTNVTPKILSLVGKNLHLQKSHPLGQLCRKIVQFMYKAYLGPRGNPLFSVFDQISPVVTTYQNFDSLLVPTDHVARQKRDNYYLNESHLLRAHTTAHQADLIKTGLNNFLVIGDVYRRDAIDSSHYPVFHQADGVRLFNKQNVYPHSKDVSDISLFNENTEREGSSKRQYSEEAVSIVTQDLKNCLSSLAFAVFGKDVEWRWVDANFPFTDPSFELEVKFDDKWIEMLGCGIIRQEILNNSGASDKIGWAFGLGLERWAMKLYRIPDIRIFWSDDPRFFSQFDFDDPNQTVVFQPFSNQPPCINDISFWIPKDSDFCSEDFYDLVRTIDDNVIEQVELIDNFTHPKTQLTSHCYRIVYRSWEKAFSKSEVNVIHKRIEKEVENRFGVKIR